MARLFATLLISLSAATLADPLAGRAPALASALMDGCGDAGCGHGSSDRPSLSMLQNHAVGVAAGKSPATGALSAAKSPTSAAPLLEGSANVTSVSVALRSQAQEVALATGSETVSATAAAGWSLVTLGLLLAAVVFARCRSEDAGPALPKYVAEFLGTFMLVFSVGCNVIAGDSVWGVVSIACTLMVSIYALGSVSGANFNPSVSLALGLSGKMPWPEVAGYVCTQLAAGVFAGLAYGLMLGSTFNLGPSKGFSWWQAGLAEALYTMMLCFVVLNTACSKRHAGKHQFFGLAIGFSIIAGGYGAGAISGGCFNPAVALGIDASSTGLGFGWCFPYFGFQIIGSCLAAGFFRCCRPDDFDEALEGQDYTLGVAMLSEFLGTFMLVLTVGLNVLAGSKAAVFSIAASLMCMIFSLGSVSGAHFNPAVTAAIFASGRQAISAGKALAYISVQLCGGIMAALAYSLMQNGTVSLKPSSISTTGEALLGEFMFTFLLSFVVLSVATVKSPLSEYFGLAIGSCVTAGGLAIGSLSGGSLNPAVSTGLAITDAANGGSLLHLPSYAAAELLAGVAAAGVFRVTHAAEYGSKA